MSKNMQTLLLLLAALILTAGVLARLFTGVPSEQRQFTLPEEGAPAGRPAAPEQGGAGPGAAPEQGAGRPAAPGQAGSGQSSTAPSAP